MINVFKAVSKVVFDQVFAECIKRLSTFDKKLQDVEINTSIYIYIYVYTYLIEKFFVFFFS